MHGINAAVEGLSDEGAAEAIMAACGLSVTGVYGRRGKQHLLAKLPAYNAAAKFHPWLVIIDLDHDAPSADEAEQLWMPSPAPLMCFSIAVREIEAWLLADATRIAEFLGVRTSRVPTHPEDLEDPKLELIALARTSSRRDIREGLVPRPGGGARVGPTYASDLRLFAAQSWRPRIAAERAVSLARCIRSVEQLSDSLGESR